MKNIIIMGSGRSGTSMVAGTLSKAGYYMGDKLWEARDANPKGFFEDIEINDLNARLLEQVIPQRIYIRGFKRLGIKPRYLRRQYPIRSQMWLASVPIHKDIHPISDITERIQYFVGKAPFCFKDPRFSYTLPVWRPYLKDTVFVCVFRDPASTAKSVLKECDSLPHLRHPITGIKMNWERAINMWVLMYQHILEKHYKQGKWLFMHFNQALTEEGLESLEQFAQVPVDKAFPESRIRRTFSTEPVSKQALDTYQRLCSLANYQEPI
jgi:hypothetical protein